MEEHARLSPSGADRWMLCSASVNMTQGYPDSESEAAAEGTRAHTALEKALRLWLATGIEQVNMSDCDDEAMHEHVTDCLTYVLEKFEALEGPNPMMQVETRVNLHYVTNRDDLWGKADIILSTDWNINCLDLKYGAGIFVPADTKQNRIYLIGSMCDHMKATGGDVPWRSATSTIMQPRYPDAEGNVFRTFEYTPEELFSWNEDFLIPAAVATDNPGEPVASAKACQFCAAKVDCPASKQVAIDLCSVFAPVSEGAYEGKMRTRTEEDANYATANELIEIHDQIPFIEGYFKAVSKRLRDMLEARDPEMVGKLKLVRSRQQNKWTLEDEELLKALTTGTGRVNKGEITKLSVISAPQALKLKSLKPAQKTKIQDLIKKSDGSLSIVPDSDPRANCFPPLTFEAVVEVALEQPEAYDFL
jgi:hypothetical protein